MNTESRWTKFFYSRWFFAATITLVVLASLAFLRAYYQDYQVRKEIERLQEEASRLEAKKLETLEILDYVRSPDFAEEKARLEMNLVKPGEQTAVIERTQPAITGQTTQKNIEWGSVAYPIKWWRVFFKSS